MGILRILDWRSNPVDLMVNFPKIRTDSCFTGGHAPASPRGRTSPAHTPEPQQPQQPQHPALAGGRLSPGSGAYRTSVGSVEDLRKARTRLLRPDPQGQSTPLAPVCPHSLPWTRYYLWGLQTEKAKSGGTPAGATGWSERPVRPRDRRSEGQENKRGGPPRFWISRTFSLNPSPQDLGLTSLCLEMQVR